MMRLGIVILLMVCGVGCAHMAPPAREPVLVGLQNGAGKDVCAVHVWTEDEEYRSVENRLLPGSQLLEANSVFRLHAGSRRDFTVPAAEPLRIEAVDCDGHLVDSREVRARAGEVVLLAIAPQPHG